MKRHLMRDKVVLVTGATDGIGKAAALELARMGAHVVIAGRSRPKTEATLSEIYKRTGSSALDMILADLAVMDDVRRMAHEFQSRYNRLDVLLNNAGGIFAQRQVTDDGHEMTFALNHLNYFLLTNLLLDTLKASAPSRIVNVSSDVHRVNPIDFNDLQNENGYGIGGFRAYGQSKMMNVIFTYELARRLQGTGVTVNVMHPGAVSTNLGTNNPPGATNLFFRAFHRFAMTPEEGAETAVYLASSPEVEGVTGKYWDNRKTVMSSSESYNESDARRLWEVSEQLTGIAKRQAIPA